MGNIMECINGLKKPQRQKFKTILLTPQQSTINSADTNASNMFLINPSVNTNISSEFNWSRIQSIYLGFSGTLDRDLNLSLPMVKRVEKLFDVLEENLMRNSKRIYYSVAFLGKTYMQKFEECAKATSNDYHIASSADRMIAHIISTIKLHRLILVAFEDNISEAREILELVALSHLVMNVTPSDFKLLDIALEKFLLQYKLIDSETLKFVVAYFSLITNYICNYIDKNTNHDLVERMLSSESEVANKRIANLHRIRKWHKLVNKLRYETSTYIEELLGRRYSEDSIPIDHSKSNKVKKACPLGSVGDIHAK